MDAAVNALHPYAILFVLIEVAKDLEKVLL